MVRICPSNQGCIHLIKLTTRSGVRVSQRTPVLAGVMTSTHLHRNCPRRVLQYETRTTEAESKGIISLCLRKDQGEYAPVKVEVRRRQRTRVVGGSGYIPTPLRIMSGWLPLQCEYQKRNMLLWTNWLSRRPFTAEIVGFESHWEYEEQPRRSGM